MKLFRVHLKNRIQNADVQFKRQAKDLAHLLPSIKREIHRLTGEFGSGTWVLYDLTEVEEE